MGAYVGSTRLKHLDDGPPSASAWMKWRASPCGERYALADPEVLYDAVLALCEASGWKWWPDQMNERKLYVVSEFFEHRDKRAKEVRKSNKGAMVPVVPDWLI